MARAQHEAEGHLQPVCPRADSGACLYHGPGDPDCTIPRTAMVPTPAEQAALIGGSVERVVEPLRITCPTCASQPGERCRRGYDGAVTQAHPARRAAGGGVRVVGPFVPDWS